MVRVVPGNNFFFFFFLRDFIFKKTLFEKIQYLKQEQIDFFQSGALMLAAGGRPPKRLPRPSILS